MMSYKTAQHVPQGQSLVPLSRLLCLDVHSTERTISRRLAKHMHDHPAAVCMTRYASAAATLLSRTRGAQGCPALLPWSPTITVLCY